MGRFELASLASHWPKEDEALASINASFPVRHQQNPVFDLGDKKTDAWVSVDDIRANLKIVGAFKGLQDAIRSPAGGQDALAGDDAWTAFIAKAVWRTELWIQGLPKDVILAENLPPPDILFIWHAYLLNPRKYFEDGSRWNQSLLSGGDYPLRDVAATIDAKTHDFLIADTDRIKRFEEQTGQPFHLPPITPSDTVQLACPFCNQELAVQLFDAVKLSGFSQSAFQAHCSCSDRPITQEMLGLAKFAKEVAQIRSDPEVYTLAYCYPNTRYGIRTPFSTRNSLKVNETLLRELDGFGDDTGNWSFENIKSSIKKAFSGTIMDDTRWVDKASIAYSHGEHFCLNLREAVNRHVAFINEMDIMGWSKPGYFDEDDGIPLGAITQYHKALHFIRTTPDAPFVPTFAIDLVWHTNLLFQQTYRELMLTLMGYIMDHDDEVEEDELVPIFYQTEQAWRDKFGVPYSFEYRGPRPSLGEINNSHANAMGKCHWLTTGTGNNRDSVCVESFSRINVTNTQTINAPQLLGGIDPFYQSRPHSEHTF